MINFIQEYPFILASLLGLTPALIWLWFWLKEDTHPEPAKILTLAFLGGMLAVFLVLPVQKLVYYYFRNYNFLSFTLWAAIEEIFKFVFVYFIALRNKVTDEPVDDIIYLVVSALGFVTLENTLFLVNPISNGDIVGVVVNSNLRFIGASLLHIMSSATIGIFMGLAFYKNKLHKRLYLITGIISAIVLHSAFNSFIIKQNGVNIFLIFGAVWVGVILLLLFFEKVKAENPKN